MQEKTRFSYDFLVKNTRFSYRDDAFYARFSDFFVQFMGVIPFTRTYESTNPRIHGFYKQKRGGASCLSLFSSSPLQTTVTTFLPPNQLILTSLTAFGSHQNTHDSRTIHTRFTQYSRNIQTLFAKLLLFFDICKNFVNYFYLIWEFGAFLFGNLAIPRLGTWRKSLFSSIAPDIRPPLSTYALRLKSTYFRTRQLSNVRGPMALTAVNSDKHLIGDSETAVP